MREILVRSLTLRGFINCDFTDQFPDFVTRVSPWVADARIRYREDIIYGLENATEAFIGLLEGRNLGKLLVRIAE